MHGQKAECWRDLCEQASVEQDPVKLMQLVQQINQMLLEKEERMQSRQQEAGKLSAA